MRNILLKAGLAAVFIASIPGMAEQPAVPARPSVDPGTRIVNADVDVPVLQPGLWEYRRTMNAEGAQPKQDVARHCTDPSADIRRKRAELAQRTCQFEPMFQKQNRFTSSWVCMSQKGAIRFQDVLTVTDASHYVDKLESRSSGAMTQQTITAERLASCALPEVKPGSPSPSPRTEAAASQR